MKRKDQINLFKMFGTLNNTKQMNTHGVGLGLFICKRIVEQFSGAIFVQSQFGKGTRFMFSFDLEEEDSDLGSLDDSTIDLS